MAQAVLVRSRHQPNRSALVDFVMISWLLPLWLANAFLSAAASCYIISRTWRRWTSSLMPAQLFSSGLLMLISCLPEIMADMAILLDFPGLITWCDVCRTVEAVASLILQLHVIHILLGLVLGAFHCPKRVFQFLLRSVPGLWPLGVAASGGIVILHVGGIDLE